MYGTLSFLCGPMFSGKTTGILKRILWACNGEKKTIKVFKPSFDKRYQKLFLTSHEGLSAPAQAISKWSDAVPFFENETIDIAFFDEVQFFESPHFEGDIISNIEILLEQGIDVVCAGLDMDWQGKPFPVSAALAAMAEEVVKLRSICSICGRPASRSFKKTQAGESVEIGSSELYEARCLAHWSQHTTYEQQNFNFPPYTPRSIFEE